MPPAIASPASVILELIIRRSERFENFNFDTEVITTVFNSIKATITSRFQCMPIAISASTIVEQKKALLGVVNIDSKIV